MVFREAKEKKNIYVYIHIYKYISKDIYEGIKV